VEKEKGGYRGELWGEIKLMEVDHACPGKPYGGSLGDGKKECFRGRGKKGGELGNELDCGFGVLIQRRERLVRNRRRMRLQKVECRTKPERLGD